jgi:monovalent cation:H+ antiporter-2, CPA2 family
VKTARELREEIIVLTRTTYLRDAEPLRRAGAEVIVSEAEVALAMTENVLVRLGATAEQLDRARARVRSDIDGGEQGDASPTDLRQLRSLHEPA